MIKLIIIYALVSLLLSGCDERYRYPCQDPNNWENKECKKPFCSGNGTCPEDISHYLKDSDKEKQKQPQQPQKNVKGNCK